MTAHRALSAEMSALMAALRLTLTPADAQALADLRDAAQLMVPTDGETATRQRFRVAAQVCGADPSPTNFAALKLAMNEFNRADLLPGLPPPEDPWRRRRQPGRNGVAAAQPRDPDDLYTDM